METIDISILAVATLFWCIIGTLGYEAVRVIDMSYAWRIYCIVTSGPLVWGLSLYRGLQYLRNRMLARYRNLSKTRCDHVSGGACGCRHGDHNY